LTVILNFAEMISMYKFDKRLSLTILIFLLLGCLFILVSESRFGISSKEETSEINARILSFSQVEDVNDMYYFRLSGYSNLFIVKQLFGQIMDVENLKFCSSNTNFTIYVSKKETKHLNNGGRIDIYGITDSSRVYLDLESTIQQSKIHRKRMPIIVITIFIPLSIFVYYARRKTCDAKIDDF
jgi:hypothetical protein